MRTSTNAPLPQLANWMVEDDKADEEADRVVQEVTNMLLDLGVLRKHVILEKSHTNGEKSYQCVQCSFACVHLSALRRHKVQHTGDKPYECDQCDTR